VVSLREDPTILPSPLRRAQPSPASIIAIPISLYRDEDDIDKGSAGTYPEDLSNQHYALPHLCDHEIQLVYETLKAEEA
jgi:hypothetical protein